MERKMAPYVYGSAAKAAPRPYYNNEEEIRRRQQERRNPQRGKRRRPRVDRVSALLVCLTFVVAMAVGISFLYLQFEATYRSKNVVNLENKVMEMERNIAAEEMELENTMNLKQIYRKATKELGMKEATEEQIHTYESKKSTQVRQHGELPTG